MSNRTDRTHGWINIPISPCQRSLWWYNAGDTNLTTGLKKMGRDWIILSLDYKRKREPNKRVYNG